MPSNNEIELVALYEDESLSVEEIAASTGYERAIVIAVLLARSTKYRNEQKALAPGPKSNGAPENELQPLVSKDEIAEFIEAYKSIARNADDDQMFIKEKVLRNLINLGGKVTDGLGEHSPRQVMNELNKSGVNINTLNVFLKASGAAKDKIKSSPMFGVIDVEATTQ